jgi:hypothetical protein
MVPIRSVATMGTIECLEELRLFLISLSVMESHSAVVDRIRNPLRVLVGTTTAAIARLTHESGPASTSTARPEVDYIRRHGQWLGDPTAATGGGTTYLNLPGLVVEFTPQLDRYTVAVEPCGDGGSETRLKPAVINRGVMERTKGYYFPSLHSDFMMEKANLMERCLTLNATNTEQGPGTRPDSPLPSPPAVGDALNGLFGNVLFLDCDIVTLAPLPLVPAVSAFGVSPHGIRPLDEALFGHFNGGWVYCADPTVLFLWRAATQRSRYFDQSSLEDVVQWYRGLEPAATRKIQQGQGSNAAAGEGAMDSPTVMEFPPQHNFGYWRMFQTEGAVDQVVQQFDLVPAGGVIRLNHGARPEHGGNSQAVLGGPQLIGYQGEPLQSIHTHFTLPSTNKAMPLFNQLLMRWMKHAVSLSFPDGGGKDLLHPYEPILEELGRAMK